MGLCQTYFDRAETACEAEDAVQETFLRLWQMREQLDSYRSLEALALLIARNVCLDALRRSDARHEPLDDAHGLASPLQADERAIAGDAERMVAEALARLPKRQRRMLLLRSEGRSMAEIAGICGTTPSSVKTMICAGRRQMRKLLKMKAHPRHWRIAFLAVLAAFGGFALMLRTESVTEIQPQTTHRPTTVPTDTLRHKDNQKTNIALQGQAEPTLPREVRTTTPHVAKSDRHETPVMPKADGMQERMERLMEAANYQEETVVSYELRPVGDATIVTKTLSNGRSSSCIIATNDEGEGYRIIPLSKDL